MKRSHKTILIVEDDEISREALVTKLTEAGFSVLEAKDGKEGLKIVFKYQPDLILLDIIMPKMHGLSMLKKLREDKRSRKIPIILLSNLGKEQIIAEAIKIDQALGLFGENQLAKVLEEEEYDYCFKPECHIDDIVEKVKQKLGIS